MVEGLASAYRGRKVLVTGHTGFKGAWLVQWLSALDAHVTGIALPGPVSEPSLFELAKLVGTCSDLRFDIRERERLAGAIDQAAPDLIFHLAGQALVRRGYADPLGTFATNVAGTANVLAAVRGHAMAGVVAATSDKVYRNDERGQAFREDDPLGGGDPYSASKAAAEAVINGFRGLEGMPLVSSVRAGNVRWRRLERRPNCARYRARRGGGPTARPAPSGLRASVAACSRLPVRLSRSWPADADWREAARRRQLWPGCGRNLQRGGPVAPVSEWLAAGYRDRARRQRWRAGSSHAHIGQPPRGRCFGLAAVA